MFDSISKTDSRYPLRNATTKHDLFKVGFRLASLCNVQINLRFWEIPIDTM